MPAMVSEARAGEPSLSSPTTSTRENSRQVSRYLFEILPEFVAADLCRTLCSMDWAATRLKLRSSAAKLQRWGLSSCARNMQPPINRCIDLTNRWSSGVTLTGVFENNVCNKAGTACPNDSVQSSVRGCMAGREKDIHQRARVCRRAPGRSGPPALLVARSKFSVEGFFAAEIAVEPGAWPRCPDGPKRNQGGWCLEQGKALPAGAMKSIWIARTSFLAGSKRS